jgi:hypothetical protein
MPLYWLVYRHNNQIPVVIEPGASLIHARMRAALMSWMKASLPKATIGADFRFQQNGNRSNVSRDGRLGG